MLRIIKTAVLVVGVSSCSARMVNAPGQSSAPSPYAPVNERSRGGVVRYLNQGLSPFIRSRREDAYRQMYEACSGTYRIDAEGPRSEGGIVEPIQGGGASYSETQYWYIQFSCVPQGPSAAPPNRYPS